MYIQIYNQSNYNVRTSQPIYGAEDINYSIPPKSKITIYSESGKKLNIQRDGCKRSFGLMTGPDLNDIIVTEEGEVKTKN